MNFNTKLFLSIIFIIIQISYSQSIDAKLGGNTDSETFEVIDSNDNTLLKVQGDGDVGIGVDDPNERLEVDGNIVVSGTVDGIDISIDVTANNAKITDDDEGVSEQYSSSWDTKTEAPTKNDVYDKFESLPAGSDDQKIDVFSISGNNIQLSLESDGEATKTVDISNATAVSANTAKVTDDDEGVSETYGSSWDSKTEAPTKNDVYDKIESITSSHDAVTIGTANGLSLSTQQLSLSAATTSAAGAMSSSDKTKLGKIASSGTSASGSTATAIGRNSTASGKYSTAIGDGPTASGEASTAFGRNTKATGISSTAMGGGSEANGNASTAMGIYAEANADYSVVINYGEVNKKGSYIFTDASTSIKVTEDNYENRFTARFANGYKLYTNKDLNKGVYLGPNAIAWGVLSDKNKKENFRKVDCEEVLTKIGNMELTSWNMKDIEDPKKDRHYGPMAQDFFEAFGHDGFGTVGNDTTICTLDLDGINMIGIQALEKRTNQLKKENEELRIFVEELVARIEELEGK